MTSKEELYENYVAKDLREMIDALGPGGLLAALKVQGDKVLANEVSLMAGSDVTAIDAVIKRLGAMKNKNTPVKFPELPGDSARERLADLIATFGPECVKESAVIARQQAVNDYVRHGMYPVLENLSIKETINLRDAVADDHKKGTNKSVKALIATKPYKETRAKIKELIDRFGATGVLPQLEAQTEKAISSTFNTMMNFYASHFQQARGFNDLRGFVTKAVEEHGKKRAPKKSNPKEM